MYIFEFVAFLTLCLAAFTSIENVFKIIKHKFFKKKLNYFKIKAMNVLSIQISFRCNFLSILFFYIFYFFCTNLFIFNIKRAFVCRTCFVSRISDYLNCVHLGQQKLVCHGIFLLLLLLLFTTGCYRDT